MPHTTKTPKKIKQKKVIKPKKKSIWKHFYYKWADYEYPGAQHEDETYYEGTYDELINGEVKNLLFPAIKRGYITMEDEDDNTLTSPPEPDTEIIVRFVPEKLVKKMHKYIPKDILINHYLALEECGWDVDGWKDGERKVYRS